MLCEEGLRATDFLEALQIVFREENIVPNVGWDIGIQGRVQRLRVLAV